MSDDLNVKIGGDPAGAIRAMDAVRDRAREMAHEIVHETAKMAAEFFSFEKVLEGVRETIIKADELRDLSNSLAIFTGSIKNATETLRFFEEVQKQSRDTGDEMAHVYRDLLPQAMARGFSQESMRPITLWLSQLGTISGKTFATMEAGFQQVLAGRARATNPVFEALGITKAQIANLGWDELIAKMDEVAGHFPDMGQSFESLMHKMKDSIVDNIGAGINDALGGGHGLADNLAALFESPETVATLHNVGEFIGNLLKGDIISAISGGEIEKALQDIRDHPLGHWSFTLPGSTAPDTGSGGGGSGGWGGKMAQPAKTGKTPEQLELEKRVKEEAERMGKVAAEDAAKAFEALWKKREEDFRAAVKVGTWKDVNKNILAPKEIVDQQSADEAAKLFSDGLKKYNDWSLVAGKTFAQVAAEELRLRIHDNVIGGLTEAFVGLGEGGGKGFMRALENQLPGLMSAGAKNFAEILFGHQGTGTINPKTGKFEETGQVYGGLIDAQKHPGAAGAVNTGMLLGSVGLGAYQAGKQAPSNAIAMGAMQGAMAGLSSGNIYVAIAAAIVGAIAGGTGAAQTRSEYQFTNPAIDANGQVKLYGSRNITYAQQQQMTGQVQDTVDSTRNQYTRLLMKLGGSQPQLGGIGGEFYAGSPVQSNPSAHFMEHFQQWMSQTLPRELAGQFRAELKGGFGNIGLSGGQFDSMWSKMSGLDPSKMGPMLTGLADALIKINDATKFMGADFGKNLYDVQAKGLQTFAQSMKEGDTKILDFAGHLKDLVGEDQIRAAGELGDMMNQRMQAEKQFLQQIADALKAGKEAADLLGQTLQLRLMHKADGTPDYEAQAQFFRSDAQKQLGLIGSATNSADAQKAYNAYLADLNNISQLGANIGMKTGDDWTKWAQDQINAGQTAFDDVLHALGDAATSQDAKFLEAIQPSIDAFKDSLGGTNVIIGNFGDATGNATIAVTDFAAALVAATQLLRANAAAGSDGFVSRTAANRARV